MNGTFSRFYFPKETSPNGQSHTPTIDVNENGTCTYFGKEPNRLMYLIIKETRDKKLTPDELTGVVQRISGVLPMYANQQWLFEQIGGTPELFMNFIVQAKENDSTLHSIKSATKTLCQSLLEASDDSRVEYFKSFIKAHKEVYCNA